MGSTLLSPQQYEAADPVERKHVAAPASLGAGSRGGGVSSAVQRFPSDKGTGGVG